MGTLRRLTWLTLLLAVSGKPALADLSYLEKTVDGFRYLVVDGSFEKSDDVGEFRAAVIRHNPQALTFSSRGGMILKALELGREIRSFDLATFQERDNSCMSACAYAFMGGSIRFAEPGSIGVHKVWFAKAIPESKVAVSTVQEITAKLIEYMGEMGVDTGLLSLALQIESDDIRFLTREEMLTYNVTTGRVPTSEQMPVLPKIELVRPPPASKPPAPMAQRGFLRRPPVSRKRTRKLATRAKNPPVPTPRPEAPLPHKLPVLRFVPRGEKMILYEELTASRTTADDGRVVWNIVRESPGDDLPPEPAIQANIEVPSKGLSAIMTIKRNADGSLPASHIIEIIFVLGESFDGNGIRSIQNFAMKQTEEDTGDRLTAVPAKITDSFFMIALNDFSEAVELNLSLMRDRNWIDLAVAYGNGRRALFTMEKGTTGAEVFDQVIRAWGWEAAASPKTRFSGPGVWKQTPSGSWYKAFQ